MVLAPDVTIFKHDPLPDPDAYFRLLKIAQGSFDEPVVCELSVWRIDEPPPYIARSYVWGDPESTATITIAHKPVTVRKNCEYVLQQQASARDVCDHYFWADAICIDQESTHERNYQVALIGKLYSNAACVHACIGPHADDSDLLFNTTGRTHSLISRIQEHQALVGVQNTDSHPMQRRLQFLCYCTVDARMRQSLLNAMVSFFKRPYFTRVWVLQELFLGKHVSICCGISRQPVTYMLAFRKLVEIWVSEGGDFEAEDSTIAHVSEVILSITSLTVKLGTLHRVRVGLDMN